MHKIRIVIIEDNKLLRDGIKAMLNEYEEFDLIAAFGDGIKVISKMKDLKPDILLLDMGLVNHNSLKLVKSLKNNIPDLKIIIMDLLPIKSNISQFLEQGVTGFIMKDASTSEFIDSIKMVAKGEKIFPPQLDGSMFTEIIDEAVTELLDSKLIKSIRLTVSEKKITDLISSGLTDEEIAAKLKMTVAIVRGHVDNIMEKMSISSRVQIAITKNPE